MTEDTFKNMTDREVMVYAKALSVTIGKMLEMERKVLSYIRSNPELMAKYIRSIRNG